MSTDPKGLQPGTASTGEASSRTARKSDVRPANGRGHSAREPLKAATVGAKPKKADLGSESAKVAQTAQPAGATPSPTGLARGPVKTTPTNAAAAFAEARRRMASAKTVHEPNNVSESSKGVMNVVEKKGKGQEPAAVVPSTTPTEIAAPHGVRPGMTRAPLPKAPAGVKGQGFKTGEYIVYPAHGVGQITAVEQQEVAGYKLELFVISFVKDKMILKVPLPKIASVGMRKLAEPPVMRRALDTLAGRARIKRTMWSRRAQEYEAKINSGDLISIAEVVRDLYRSDAQPEQSYSERQLYEAALDRMAREIAVVEKLTDTEALKLIDDQLQKGPRRVKAEDAEVDGEDGDEDEGGIVEAA